MNKKSDFYSYSKRGDLWRVPVIKPYEIVSPTNAQNVKDWSLIIKKPNIHNKDYFDKVNDYDFQLSDIDSIGVCDSILVFKASSFYWPKFSGNYKTTFIINAKTKEQFIFLDQHQPKELQNTLEYLGVKQIKLYSFQKIKDDFQLDLVLPKDWTR